MRIRESIRPQEDENKLSLATKGTGKGERMGEDEVGEKGRLNLWKPCPSILSTRKVLGRRGSGSSNDRTYAKRVPAIREGAGISQW